MTEAVALELAKQTLMVTMKVTLPILTLTLIAGLTISIFQAVTQVQEFTLTFIPKILAAILALLFLGPWMLTMLLNFTSRILINLPNYVK